MDSIPPATITSYSPSRISCEATAMASRPDRHTLFTVSAGTVMLMPRRHGGLPGGDLPGARLQHLPHDHVLHLVRADARALEGGRDGDAAQLAGRLAGEGPEQAADRCPCAADDNRLT